MHHQFRYIIKHFRIAIQFYMVISLQIWTKMLFGKIHQKSVKHASFMLCHVRSYGESQALMWRIDFVIFRLIKAIWNHCIKKSEKLWKNNSNVKLHSIAGTTTESLIEYEFRHTAQYCSTYDSESCSVICFLIYCTYVTMIVDSNL